MTLYADILFLINFIMNAFVLWLAFKITRSARKRRWWMAGGAVMALLYALLLVIEPLRGLNMVMAQTAILAAGVFVAFYPRDLRAFLKQMLVTYLISFTVGGLGMALFYLTDLPYALHYIAADIGAFSRAVSWQLALTGMALSYAFIKLGQFLLERRSLKKQMLCSVQISSSDTNVSLTALVDTGHSLREPISQAPVIVAEFERVRPFLPEGLQKLFSEKRENDLTGLLLGQENAFYTRLRMIPFTSLGRKSGMLVGFRPDKVMVRDENEVRTRQDIVIGIYNDRFTRDGRYQGLLSSELVS